MDDVPAGDRASLRERFVADHLRLVALLEKALDALESRDRASGIALWSEFVEGTVRHLRAEEETLIPELFAARRREARVISEEHRHLRSRMAEIAGEIAHGAPPSTGRAFVHELRAHAAHEETVLYHGMEERMTASERVLATASLGPSSKATPG